MKSALRIQYLELIRITNYVKYFNLENYVNEIVDNKFSNCFDNH